MQPLPHHRARASPAAMLRTSRSRLFITSHEFESWPPLLQEAVFQSAYKLAPTSTAFSLTLDHGDLDFTPDFLDVGIHRRLRIMVNKYLANYVLESSCGAPALADDRAADTHAPPCPSFCLDVGCREALAATSSFGFEDVGGGRYGADWPPSPTDVSTASVSYVQADSDEYGDDDDDVSGSPFGDAGRDVQVPRTRPAGLTRPLAPAGVSAKPQPPPAASPRKPTAKTVKLTTGVSQRAGVVPSSACGRGGGSGGFDRYPPNLSLKDSAKAELYLSHVREVADPRGDDFKAFVTLMSAMMTPADDDVAYGLRLYGARPKYVLRKLCFSLLPEGSVMRERFVANELCLPTVNTQQRECVKEDLVEILYGICRRCPALARIPTVFCHKD